MKTLLFATIPAVLASCFFLLSSVSVCVAADAPWCQSADLTLETLRGSAAAGTLAQLYAFQNHSPKSCALGGFPSLRALDRQGKPVKGIEFKRLRAIFGAPDRTSIPSRIILKPGEEAWFQVVYTTASIYHGDVDDRSMCHSLDTLLIAPPRNRKPLAAQFAGDVCNPVRFTPVFLPTRDQP